ncbi:MAG: hypothetical protein IKE89_01915 [Bacilli bacterium]|nr:hypothetical protein [Bacilli bacterium]
MNNKIKIILIIVVISLIIGLIIVLIPNKYIMVIEPQYMPNKVSNKVKLSNNNYLITKFDKDGDEITYKKGKLKEEITEDLLNRLEEENNLSVASDNRNYAYKVTYKKNKVYFLYEDSKFIKEIEKLIDSDKIWYINDNTIETE